MDEGMGWNDKSQRTVRRQLEAFGRKDGWATPAVGRVCAGEGFDPSGEDVSCGVW